MKVDGVRICFKNINRCNLHPQCDPVKGSGDDKTSEDELDCDDEYRRKKLISRQATFRCQSPHHNEDSVKANLSRGVVWIKAVPQDGVKECWKDEDEAQSVWYLSYLIIGDIQNSNISLMFEHSSCIRRCLGCYLCICWFHSEKLLWIWEGGSDTDGNDLHPEDSCQGLGGRGQEGDQ